ncbi:MAG TPA: M24 family metallopeptidase, partial [Rhodanobacteraceae bacterium]|nr:M24 family metallopeptidase [Rhodanobacteraceae bacterium]
EVQCYASDITRTVPVGGKFSREQRALYEVVLEAQAAAIDAVRVGAPYDAAHHAATLVIAEGLCALKLLRGSARAALRSGAYQRFFPHKTGHWIGLDVHDVGDYHVDGEPRLLEPGMALTVEPGLYVPPDDTSVPPRWRGLGVRIEDDVVVAARGPEVLTSKVPKEPAELEELCA